MQETVEKKQFVHIVLQGIVRARVIIFAVAIALVVGIIAMIIINNLQDAKLNEATLMMESLDSHYNNWLSETDTSKKSDLLDKMQKETDTIGKSFPGSYYYQRASFLLGSLAFESKTFDKAQELFVQAISVKTDSYLASMCLFNAAISAEQAGKIDDSLSLLNRLVTEYSAVSPDVPRALINIGRILESKNQYKEAGDTYTRVVDEFVDSDWTKIARDRIIFLKTQQKI